MVRARYLGVRTRKARRARPSRKVIPGLKAVELFAGAGGLALATAAAGFRHQAVVELDDDAHGTLDENKRRGVIDWPIIHVDSRHVDYSQFASADLVAAGPPCQPFSIGGKHRGQSDHRNLFPEVARAVREIQ